MASLRVECIIVFIGASPKRPRLIEATVAFVNSWITNSCSYLGKALVWSGTHLSCHFVVGIASVMMLTTGERLDDDLEAIAASQSLAIGFAFPSGVARPSYGQAV